MVVAAQRRAWKAAGVLIFVLAGHALHAGCLGGRHDLPLGALCRSSDECSGTLVCQFGRCRSRCTYDRDCPDGQACVSIDEGSDERVCTVGDEGEGSEVECPEPLVRLTPEDACRMPCPTDDDAYCGDGRYCDDGVCRDEPITIEPDAEVVSDADVAGADGDAPDADATGADGDDSGDDSDGADGDDLDAGADASLDGEADVPLWVVDEYRVVAGEHHTCALLDGGELRCWGRGYNGQLGYANQNNIGDDELPSEVGPVSTGGTVIGVACGGIHTCVLFDFGELRCWGAGSNGRLGYGNVNNIGVDELPSTIRPLYVGGTVVQIAAGNAHTCAILEGGHLRCWGLGLYGQLGYGDENDIGDDESPTDAGPVSVGGVVARVALGWSHTCALLETGAIRCWGQGLNGRLGLGNTNNIGDDELPSTVDTVSVGGSVVQVAAGASHTCALLETGDLRCWGYGMSGRLGYGNTNNIGDDELPSTVGNVDVGGRMVQVTAGALHTCALLGSGNLRCWGGTTAAGSPLGYGDSEEIGDDELPSEVGNVEVGGRVAQVTAGGYHTCGLLIDDELRCWGQAIDGQLGYGNQNDIGDDLLPSDVGPVSYR